MEAQIKSQSGQMTGSFMMAAAAVLFATGGLALKFIDWSPLAINGVRSFFGAIAIGLYMIKTRHKLRFNRVVWLGAISYASMTTMFVMANKMTTAANAIVLQYTCPIWLILLVALIYHQWPSKNQLIAVLCTGAGILCFFWDSLSSGSMAGDLIALISGLFYAILFMLNGLKGGDALCSVFLGMCISFVFLSPIALFEPALSTTGWACLIWLGLFQVGVAYILFCEATRILDPVKAALITGLEPVLSPILVAVFWHETLTTLSLIGAVIVITAVSGYSWISAKEGN